MIIREEKANLKLCRLNLRMPQVVAFIESIRWRDFVERRRELSLLVSDILQRCELPYLTLLVFGSYARGTATKRSDLDMLIIVPDRKFEESVEVAVESARALSKITLHHIIVSYSEFVNMLGEKKTNIAKEALEARYIAYGAEPFYEMVCRSA
jgi:predicted nucleotidyltransferase